jgi:hypothetical protein
VFERILAVAIAALASTSVARGDLTITEVMYNPASNESTWEWVEVLNSGPMIDFAATPYVIDDENGTFHQLPNVTSGFIPSNGIAVLYDADLSASAFVQAWGDVVTLIPVEGWSAMQLNNGSDRIGIWGDYDAYAGDHETHANALVSFAYSDDPPFPADDDSGSIHLPQPWDDPHDGAAWRLSALDDGAWMSVAAAGNSGLDVGSPGVLLGEGACEPDCGPRDGAIDVNDLLWLLGAWGVGESGCDLDGDGVVGTSDLLTLLEAWGPCPAP